MPPALDFALPDKARNDSTVSPLQVSPAHRLPETPAVAHATTNNHAPDSPPRPPVSPITPVATIAQLAPSDQADRVIPPPALDFMPQPPSKSIDETENTDAIALRSAIALLQIQRDKSKKDIQTLQKIKQAAVAEPEAFVDELKSGRLKPKRESNDVLGPTLGGLESLLNSDQEDSDDEARSPTSGPPPPKFGPVPEMQNIFRCPPINWDKYHVVGESLDKIHLEQRQRPGHAPPGQMRAPVHRIAAPYSPFTDRITQQNTNMSQPRRASKKPG
ncbi:uncharacterized protein J3D65DRAFT_214940 [Phyllosticta citribraziliensis]|uniref:Uncharacterized protein n=1 Tax=Phyllosticta citribraziliensis TaxID=989973 RepID=A0ABR1M4B6_9PEZI